MEEYQQEVASDIGWSILRGKSFFELQAHD